VEFIVPGDEPDEFFFMEMNTRLQVEHPVTELVTGLDLVEWQLRVAAGEPLPLRQEEIRLTGHAAEARIYAEDPARGFLPTGGTVLALGEPTGPHVRTDSGLAAGMTVTSAYDPMLAKIIAWAPDREAALRRLDAALAATAVLGVATNTAFLRALLSHPDVLAGRLDTGLVERHLGELTAAGVPDEVLAAAALAELLASQPAGPVTDPWDIPDGWRPGEHAWTRLRLACAPRETAEVRIRAQPARAGTAVAAEVSVDGAGPVAASAASGPDGLLVTYAGQTRRYACARDGAGAAGSGVSRGGVIWLGTGGRTWMVREEEALAVRRDRAGGADGTVRSPMPGTVQAVPVTVGQPVTAGQPLVIVEAMKMEHTVTAPLDGTVTELLVKGGQQVAMDETLAVVRAAGPAAPDGGPAPDGSADPAAPDEPGAP
jgi:acetyl-CoA/propionyl-CoA carboxylase biotin carboxyl carrier protein